MAAAKSPVTAYWTSFTSIHTDICIDIGHYWIKVKFTVGLQLFPPFTTIQTGRSYKSTFLQDRNVMFMWLFYIKSIKIVRLDGLYEFL